MNFKLTLNKITKTYFIILIAVITLTSVEVQTAAASELLPTPVFTTATQMVYDAIQEQKTFQIPVTFENNLPETKDRPNASYTKIYTVTAFNSVPWQTDSTPCISADGSNICHLKEMGDESCAAALPFGTKLDIPGFGTCTVRDRLAPKYAGRIDIYFGGAEQLTAAKQWGKRHLEVQVIRTI